jgi:hypothetical protein
MPRNESTTSANEVNYTQGQYLDENTREYFYYVDHQGQVALFIKKKFYKSKIN